MSRGVSGWGGRETRTSVDHPPERVILDRVEGRSGARGVLGFWIEEDLDGGETASGVERGEDAERGMMDEFISWRRQED